MPEEAQGLPGTMLSQPEVQGVITPGLVGEKGSLTRSPGRVWRGKEVCLEHSGGQRKSRARPERVGSQLVGSQVKGERVQVQWLRSGSWWLWPESFMGGWAQKPDHSGLRRDDTFPDGLKGRLENDGAAPEAPGRVVCFQKPSRLKAFSVLMREPLRSPRR